MNTIMDGLSTLDDIDVEGRRVLLRTDFNVPLCSAPSGGSMTVADDSRVRAALPTIEELLRRGARVVLVSHLDGPERLDSRVSMRPVAELLAKLTGAAVPLAPGVTGPAVRALTEQLAPGTMLMLENVRLAAGEAANDPWLASELAELADLYVADALVSVDRAHASTEGVAHLLPCAVGRLMEREILALSAVVDQPARPLVAVLGGDPAEDRLGLIRRFLKLADTVCLGGAVCLPFLRVLGRRIGHLRCSAGDLERAWRALSAGGRRGRLALPLDLLLSADGSDIGPETVERYAAEIDAAATVFWTGPMGRLDLPAFAAGTRGIANAVACTSATTVVGGRETVDALRAYGLQDRVSHVSSADDAALKLVEGCELPGLEALRAAVRRRTIIQSV